MVQDLKLGSQKSLEIWKNKTYKTKSNTYKDHLKKLLHTEEILTTDEEDKSNIFRFIVLLIVLAIKRVQRSRKVTKTTIYDYQSLKCISIPLS